MKQPSENKYVVCVKNTGYRTSLIVRRIYMVVADPDAWDRGLIRIIDESGEDYLFPKTLFTAVELPDEVGRAFAMVT